jgi:hypothetical protein
MYFTAGKTILFREEHSPRVLVKKVDYVRRTLDMDLISSGGGRELYAVQGAWPANIRASR